MHAEAYAFVERTAIHLELTGKSVCDFGGRNVNGSCRDIFTGDYLALDQWAGEGVDIVADAVTYTGTEVEVALCTEVLEHCEQWRELVANLARNTKRGGVVIITCATDDRNPHSAVDGCELRAGEYYGNVSEQELREALSAFSDNVHTEVHRWPAPHFSDLYAWAVIT